MYSQHITTPTIEKLHKAGLHFVRCREKDADGKKAKSALDSRWQHHPATLEHVLKHRAAGGLLGFIPGRTDLLVIDIDTFPTEDKDATGLVARLGVTPLAVIRTPRGIHLYLKKTSDDGEVGNRAWSLDGFAGDVRCDHGYCIAWQMDRLAEALDRLPGAAPTPNSLFPKPTKSSTAGKGFAVGHRTDTLNARVFGAEMRGETNHSEVIEQAIAAGLPAEKVAKANAKTIADAQAAKARTSEAPISEHLIALGFTEKYRDTMRYCPELGSWFEWDKTRWRPDKLQRAFHFSRTLAGEAGKGKDTRRASFARGVESFCRADPAHAVPASYWDADPWLLGTPTGTIDLKTGRVLAADPAHRITKLTAVGPGKSDECPRWLRFLDECTGSDNQLVGFLQRWFGYCLTGSVQEHALIFLYGGGCNGKSVFLNVLSGILGDHSVTANMDILIAAQHDRHPTEIAALAGARLVTASETEEQRLWAEARVKALTGGEPLSARFMRRDLFEFLPQFKLALSGNQLPALHNCGAAMRRRFNLVPFDRVPARPDLELADKLKSEWPGILAWAIEGCALWQQEGLGSAAVIEEETNQYFDESNHFAAWFEADCELDPEAYELATDLFTSWSKYLKRIKEPEENNTKFGRRLRATRGLHKQKVGTVRWIGVRLTGMDSYPV